MSVINSYVPATKNGWPPLENLAFCWYGITIYVADRNITSGNKPRNGKGEQSLTIWICIVLNQTIISCWKPQSTSLWKKINCPFLNNKHKFNDNFYFVFYSLHSPFCFFSKPSSPRAKTIPELSKSFRALNNAIHHSEAQRCKHSHLLSPVILFMRSANRLMSAQRLGPKQNISKVRSELPSAVGTNPSLDLTQKLF